MKVHEAIAEALAVNGVDTMFSLLGDGNLWIGYSFVHRHGGRHIGAAHEGAATMMADGYARASGRLGVASVTHGPGMTNTLTALVEGSRNGTPMLVIVGDTDREDFTNRQSISQREFIMATGAGFEPVRSARTAPRDVTRAIRRAHLERRPIVLNVPVDISSAEFDSDEAATRVTVQENPSTVLPNPAQVEGAAGLLSSVRRPVVVAGRGAMSEEGRAAVLRLADRVGAPVATTVLAKDLFRGLPHNLGFFGTLSHPVAVDTIMEADCVVAFGASLNPWTASRGSFLADKRVIHVNVDPTHVGRYYPADVGVVGDAAHVADALTELLDEAEVAATGFRTPALAERLAAEDLWEYTDRSTATTIDLRTFMRELDRLLPVERTVVIDNGRFQKIAIPRLQVAHPRHFVFTSNFGSVGLGMSGAVGAAIGAADRPSVAVLGDGGFMMAGMAEFNAAVRHGADLIAIVCNDGTYGPEFEHLENAGLDPQITAFDWPDFAPIADALGGTGITVRNVDDLAKLADSIANRTTPLLVDVKVDPVVLAEPGS